MGTQEFERFGDGGHGRSGCSDKVLERVKCRLVERCVGFLKTMALEMMKMIVVMRWQTDAMRDTIH